MIVCVCRGASERDILKAIGRGASSLTDLQRCGIGPECGSCHNMLRKMLADSLCGADTPVCASAQAGVPVPQPAA